MNTVRNHDADTVLTSLEAAAALARGGFACTFSTSAEYETALITERRAQGRYQKPRPGWPMILFIGCCLMVVGFVIVAS